VEWIFTRTVTDYKLPSHTNDLFNKPPLCEGETPSSY